MQHDLKQTQVVRQQEAIFFFKCIVSSPVNKAKTGNPPDITAHKQ